MSKLFTAQKKPIQFFMEPHQKRSAIQKQIEKHGGKLLTSRKPDTIELVPHDIGTPFSSSITRQVYSYKYIKDCISAHQVLDLKDYSLVKHSLIKSGTRKGYRAEDEEKILKYIESHDGSPYSIKFWKDAISKGLDLSHSADSLRYHWKNIMIKRKRNDGVYKGKGCSDETVKKMKVENLVMPDEDEMKSIRVLVVRGKRNIVDFSDINVRCEEEEIDEKFLGLVEICSRSAGRKVTDQEVLRALVARGGKIKETIEHFTAIY